jgi:hypothetical protein
MKGQRLLTSLTSGHGGVRVYPPEDKSKANLNNVLILIQKNFHIKVL